MFLTFFSMSSLALCSIQNRLVQTILNSVKKRSALNFKSFCWVIILTSFRKGSLMPLRNQINRKKICHHKIKFVILTISSYASLRAVRVSTRTRGTRVVTGVREEIAGINQTKQVKLVKEGVKGVKKIKEVKKVEIIMRKQRSTRQNRSKRPRRSKRSRRSNRSRR